MGFEGEQYTKDGERHDHVHRQDLHLVRPLLRRRELVPPAEWQVGCRPADRWTPSSPVVQAGQCLRLAADYAADVDAAENVYRSWVAKFITGEASMDQWDQFVGRVERRRRRPHGGICGDRAEVTRSREVPASTGPPSEVRTTELRMPKSLRGRVRAMLHGVALGDALGAPVEKLSAAEIRPALWPGDLARYTAGTRWILPPRRGTGGCAAMASSPTIR